MCRKHGFYRPVVVCVKRAGPQGFVSSDFVMSEGLSVSVDRCGYFLFQFFVMLFLVLATDISGCVWAYMQRDQVRLADGLACWWKGWRVGGWAGGWV